jgi:hypothetical protein
MCTKLGEVDRVVKYELLLCLDPAEWLGRPVPSLDDRLAVITCQSYRRHTDLINSRLQLPWTILSLLTDVIRLI